MSQLKLTADSGGGTVAFAAPSSTTSNAAITFKVPVADGSTGQYIKTDGSGNLAFATVDTHTYGLIFEQWRVNTLFSGAADPITNWTESTNNCTFSESSGIFTFPSTGFWRIHMHLYGYYNADSDNAELHIMRTTNNSSYTHKTHSYTSLNNDDGGNLYTTLECDLVFDVTDVSTH